MRTRFTSATGLVPQLVLISQFRAGLVSLCLLLLLLIVSRARADVPTGSREDAELYYRKLSAALNYSTPDKIGETTLTDLALYLGYTNLTADQLEFDSPRQLMAKGGDGEVLVSRFFAPKIMNVKFKEGDQDFKVGLGGPQALDQKRVGSCYGLKVVPSCSP